MRLAFHSDKLLKANVVEAVANIHNATSPICPKPEACLINCPLHAGTYREIEERLGIPAAVLALNESFFLMQEFDQMPFWNDRFLCSVAPGADLSKVFAGFVGFSFDDKRVGVLRLLTNKVLYRSVIEAVSADFLDEGKLNALKVQLMELDKNFLEKGRMTTEFEPALQLIDFTLNPDKKTAQNWMQACGAQFQYVKRGKTWHFLQRTYSEQFLEMLMATAG